MALSDIKAGGRLLILLGFVGVLAAVVWFTPLREHIPGQKPAIALVPQSVDLPNAPKMQNASFAVQRVETPSADASGVGTRVHILLWAWNSQMGLMFANGGIQSTEGSLMALKGLNVQLERQDDAAKMQEALVSFANELSNGTSNPSSGAHFVMIMGDGAAAFLQGINPVLEKLGPEYRAVVVGSCGYSRGEDGLWGPEIWKKNPASMKGCVITAYLRDGDWNIVMKFAADNGIKNNPDEHTYDPDAINWVAADSYTDAAQKYVAGYSEERPVVKNGKPTGETKKITVEGVATWTPADVTLAKERGGLVKVVSTKEYAMQMPNAIIGINKWCSENRKTVEDMLDAIFQGGDQVQAFPEALEYAGEVSATVYGEQDGDYWVRYYKGSIEDDAQGIPVELGGSKVNNLSDNVLLFGPQKYFDAPYTKFGKVVVQQYPNLVPAFPPYEQAVDGSYVMALAKRTKAAPASQSFAFKSGAPMKSVVGKRSWQIQFQTGSAEFSPSALSTLEDLKNELIVSLSLKVIIHGHTDDVGSDEVNKALSTQRARAVERWLETQAPSAFPQNRITSMGHGSRKPIADNSTEYGRSQNRRVEIVTGTTD